MGMLDSVLGTLGGQGQTSMLSVVTGLITDQNGGGLAGLLRQFQAGGLGHLADSWVGTGKNLPIFAEQIQSVLGPAQIQQMAAKAGISPEILSGQLANLLPQLVDKATPDGKLPDQDSLQQGLGSLLQGLLGGH